MSTSLSQSVGNRNGAQTDPVDFLAVARELRNRHIFPVPLRGDKRPLLSGWRESPWRNRCAVWACGAAKGLGVQCGMRRGDTGLSLIVLDFDDMASYEAWLESSPEARRLASVAPTVQTRRGVHVYLYVYGDVRSWYVKDGPIQCEGKASGNYVVAPPSVHPSGKPYEWARPLFDHEPPTAELSDLPGFGEPKHSRSINPSLCEARRETRPDPRVRIHELTCKQALSYAECESLANGSTLPGWMADVIGAHVPTGPGQRNNTLFQLATALVKAGASIETLRPLAPAIVANWHRLALSAIRTKDPAISLGDFGRGLDWLEAHWRPASPEAYELPEPAAVVALADAYPFDAGGRTITRDRIAAILRALDLLHNGRPFALDGRTLAAMAGVTQTPAMRHVKALADAGLTRVVDRGKSGEKPGERWSARYLWTGPKIEAEAETFAA